MSRSNLIIVQVKTKTKRSLFISYCGDKKIPES